MITLLFRIEDYQLTMLMKTVIDSMTVTPTENVWNVLGNILKYDKCMSFKIGVELHLWNMSDTDEADIFK